MKKILVLCLLVLWSVAAEATEYGRVISSTPVTEQVTSPRRSCWDETVEVRQPRSYGGTIIGGLTGAAIGSAFGRGDGNAAATAGGSVLGAMLGNEADRDASSELRTIRRCETVQVGSERTSYDVTYEYGGQRHTVRMARPPAGEWIPVSVSVEGERRQAADPEQGYVVLDDGPGVVYERPVVIYQDRPATRVYVAPPWPIYWGIGLHYHRSWGGHRDYHHRR